MSDDPVLRGVTSLALRGICETLQALAMVPPVGEHAESCAECCFTYVFVIILKFSFVIYMGSGREHFAGHCFSKK